jgi:hypothetical protein
LYGNVHCFRSNCYPSHEHGMFWIVHHNQYGRDADNIETISHDEVLEAAKKAESKVRKLIKELIVNY